MFVLGNLFIALGYVLRTVIQFEIIVIVASAILSWIPGVQYHRFYQALRDIADIVERPLRRFIPPIGMIDITPFIAILLLVFIDGFLVQSVLDLGRFLK